MDHRQERTASNDDDPEDDSIKKYEYDDTYREQRHMNDSTMPPPPSQQQQQRSTTIQAAAAAATTTTLTESTLVPTGTSKTHGNLTKTVTAVTAAAAAAIPTIRRKQRSALGLADWTRLLSVTKDIAQLRGQSVRRSIPMAEVRQHNTIHDGWIVLGNDKRVYNISPYLAYHPGGTKIMISVLGQDATIQFQKYHPWVNWDGYVRCFLLFLTLVLVMSF
jgi:cytochrome b involved in lipid metabolism